MKRKILYALFAVLITTVVLLSACTPAPTPEATEVPTEAVTEVATELPTEEAPCLVIGALYGGSITDAGYNQAMHEAVMAIKTNISCVEIIEAENVPDEAGATATMQNMIDQGAKMIIATAFNHQYPALALAQANPDVIFELLRRPAERLVFDGRRGWQDDHKQQAGICGCLPARLDIHLHQCLHIGCPISQPGCTDFCDLHLCLG
jgi:basic membrane lipoprotein Med (substrate-binding protein (PBP1-ABC) superfamily)